MADAMIWLTIASVLATMNISKSDELPTDDEIDTEDLYSNGALW